MRILLAQKWHEYPYRIRARAVPPLVYEQCRTFFFVCHHTIIFSVFCLVVLIPVVNAPRIDINYQVL